VCDGVESERLACDKVMCDKVVWKIVCVCDKAVCVNRLNRCKSCSILMDFSCGLTTATSYCRAPRLHPSVRGQRSYWCLERICSLINCMYLPVQLQFCADFSCFRERRPAKPRTGKSTFFCTAVAIWLGDFLECIWLWQHHWLWRWQLPQHGWYVSWSWKGKGQLPIFLDFMC